MSEHLPMAMAPESPMEKETNMSMLTDTFSEHSYTTQQTFDTHLPNLNFRRTNSSYIPRKTISRYGNAFKTMLPFRRSNTGPKEMPIDSVGFFSNATFHWVRSFRLTKENVERRRDGESLLLPKATRTDGCQTNSQRLVEIFNKYILNLIMIYLLFLNA